MRILFLGDIYGSSGRKAIIERIPKLRESLRLDFVVANGENATHRLGLSPEHAELLLASGIDVLTSGNHIFRLRETAAYIDGQPRLLRPMNYPEGTPGKGVGIYTAGNGEELAVLNLSGRVFMDDLSNPFEAMEKALDELDGKVAHVFVDFHAEATAEKKALAHFVDGRVSAFFGTHTHVPTADLERMPKGTVYLTDLGMCGDYDSVIGAVPEDAIERIKNNTFGRMEPKKGGEATLCGLFVETDEKGKATAAKTIRIGGVLMEQTEV